MVGPTTEKGFQVIVLEQDPMVLDFFSECLGPYASVIVSKRPQEYHERLGSNPNPDLVVLDTSLPRQELLNLVRHTRQGSLCTRILLTRLVPDEEPVAEALDYDISGVLSKPFTLQRFEYNIKKALIHSRILKLNDELVRSMGDLISGLKLSQDIQNGSAKGSKLQQATRDISEQVNSMISLRETLIKEFQGMSFDGKI